jgi:hypothetical protein
VVGVADDAVRSWPVVGHDAGVDPDDDWPQPRYTEHPPGHYQIYDKGVLRPASGQEVQGLEPQAVYAARHVLDRLLTGKRPRTVADLIREQLRKIDQERGTGGTDPRPGG